MEKLRPVSFCSFLQADLLLGPWEFLKGTLGGKVCQTSLFHLPNKDQEWWDPSVMFPLYLATEAILQMDHRWKLTTQGKPRVSYSGCLFV